MITLVVGTNRPNNVSAKVAKAILAMLKTMSLEAQILDLRDMPSDFAYRNEVFGEGNPELTGIIDQYFNRANYFVFVAPEYNGSFPGVLKSLLDIVPPRLMNGKTASLVGIGAGRGGNLRGLDHLTNILNYLQVTVHPYKVSISGVNRIVSDEGIHDEHTVQVLDKFVGQIKALQV